jgi:hypothetical protein
MFIKSLTATVFILLIFCSYSFSQQVADTENALQKMLFEKLEKKEKQGMLKQSLPFKDIDVLDVRPDTSFIGFYERSSGRTFKLNFVNGLSDRIKNYLHNNHIFNTSDIEAPKLVLSIKRFWVTPEVDTIVVGNRNKSVAAIMVKIEVYANFANEYKPMVRIEFDHLLPNTSKNTIEEHSDSALKKVVDEIVSHSEKLTRGGKLLSLNQIEAFNRQQFQVPILTDLTLQKGVYNTFEEFRKNNPAYKNYELKDGSLGDMIYVKDGDGKEHPTRNVWGYCDGENAYIKLSDNYFKMHRSGNAFNMFAAKEMKRKRSVKAENMLLLGLAGGGLGRQNQRTTFRLVIKPYQLDLETGEVF